ncbi:hypothetical protein ABK040_006529 [Willaertia magna]
MPEKKTKRKRNQKATKEDLENVKLYMLTRKVDDKSNYSLLKNWNRVDFRILSKPHDDKEVNIESCLNRIIACHIKEFDKQITAVTNNSTESSSENQNAIPPVEQVHLGIYCENNSNVDIQVVFEINGESDEDKFNIDVYSKQTGIFSKITNWKDKFTQKLIINKPKLAMDMEDVTEGEEEPNNKMGIIKASIYRVTYTERKGLKRKPKQTGFKPKKMIEKYNVNETQRRKATKQGAIAIGFSNPEKFADSSSDSDENKTYSQTYYTLHEKLIEYEFRYRNYMGYLLELVKAGITIEESRQQQQEIENSIPAELINAGVNPTEDTEVIELIDSDSDATSEEPPPQCPPKLPEYKSVSLMEKVKETLLQVEKKERGRST